MKRHIMSMGLTLQGKIALSLILMIIGMALFSSIITSHSFREPSASSFVSPGADHLLGTDDLGIDIWAQICHGAQVSLWIGFGSALLAGGGGTLLGILSGYHGGGTDRIVMGVCDMITIIPRLPMMIILGAFLGPSLNTIMIVIALLSWPHPARTIRSVVLSMKEENYIRAARTWGAGFFHVTFRHLLPALLPLITVSFIRISGQAIVTEAGMAFLGLGDPLSKSWGIILNRSINFPGIYFTDYWKWWIISPLAALVLLVLSMALLSRELEASSAQIIPRGK